MTPGELDSACTVYLHLHVPSNLMILKILNEIMARVEIYVDTLSGHTVVLFLNESV